MSIKCPKCGYENKDDALICGLCSELLKKQKKEYSRVYPPKFACQNHPMMPAQGFCSICKKEFCNECLSQDEGQIICTNCKGIKVSSKQAQKSKLIKIICGFIIIGGILFLVYNFALKKKVSEIGEPFYIDISIDRGGYSYTFKTNLKIRKPGFMRNVALAPCPVTRRAGLLICAFITDIEDKERFKEGCNIAFELIKTGKIECLARLKEDTPIEEVKKEYEKVDYYRVYYNKCSEDAEHYFLFPKDEDINTRLQQIRDPTEIEIEGFIGRLFQKASDTSDPTEIRSQMAGESTDTPIIYVEKIKIH